MTLLNQKFTKTAIVRVDYNVPLGGGKILDLTRIKSSLPTIKFLLKNNISIILMSHLGRPQKKDRQHSLRVLIPYLEKLTKQRICFLETPTKQKIPQGSIGLLENLRFFSGEQKNEKNFCKTLAKLGDIYINDAFGSSHRDHASISGIHHFFPQEKYKGLLLESELFQLQKLKNNPQHPYTIIVGGAKIGSKIHMLESFLNIADNILIGGGMAFPFIKYVGGKIGNSICQDNEMEIVKSFFKKAKQSKTTILLPEDCLITRSVKNKQDQKMADIMKIPNGYCGVDVGPKTIELFRSVILKSKSIMWNGPMGISEISDFSSGTRSLATSIQTATKNGAYSLVGGGDTVSDIYRLGFENSFSYVSTGGGAMLEFFKKNSLPGILNLKTLK